MYSEANQARVVSDGKSLFYILPVLLALISAISISWFAAFDMFALIIAFFIVVFSVVVGAILSAKQQALVVAINANWKNDEDTKIEDVNAYAIELERLITEISPILIRQVGTSRQHTDQEITVLTERFGVMVEQLQQIISGTGSSGQTQDIDSLFDHSITKSCCTAARKVLPNDSKSCVINLYLFEKSK